MYQLTCDELCLDYQGKIVVQNLSLQVQPGDYLSIIGENGCGKSTLMKAILGLKAPLSGQVKLGQGLKPSQIGYLPQQSLIQRDFPASVGEVVLSGCLNRRGWRPYYNQQEKSRAAHIMSRLGLAPLARDCYRELSGGQQQRVLLARALCATEKMLLLDEPVAGLDPQASGEMYALTDELNQQGITIIMISHDMAAAFSHASHILHLARQEVLFYGSKANYPAAEIGGNNDTDN